jgi:hypothetical protein
MHFSTRRYYEVNSPKRYNAGCFSNPRGLKISILQLA